MVEEKSKCSLVKRTRYILVALCFLDACVAMLSIFISKWTSVFFGFFNIVFAIGLCYNFSFCSFCSKHCIVPFFIFKLICLSTDIKVAYGYFTKNAVFNHKLTALLLYFLITGTIQILLALYLIYMMKKEKKNRNRTNNEQSVPLTNVPKGDVESQQQKQTDKQESTQSDHNEIQTTSV